jgi:hypothetical protein
MAAKSTTERKARGSRMPLGIRAKNLNNFKLPSGEVILQTRKQSPLWRLLHKELPKLLADLGQEDKYQEQVARIGELLADPQFPKVEEIPFRHVTK